MASHLVSAAITLGSGGVLLLFGYLIRVRGWAFLVAGYDDSVDVPEDVAANMVGNACLRIGIATVAIGGLQSVRDPTVLLWTIYGVAVVLASARLVYRFYTYETDSSAANTQ